MKLPANVTVDWKLAAVALVGVVGLYLLAKREVKAAAATVGTAFNITSRENVAARAVNAVVEATYGADKKGEQSAGEWIYSKVDPVGYAALMRNRK